MSDGVSFLTLGNALQRQCSAVRLAFAKAVSSSIIEHLLVSFEVCVGTMVLRYLIGRAGWWSSGVRTRFSGLVAVMVWQLDHSALIRVGEDRIETGSMGLAEPFRVQPHKLLCFVVLRSTYSSEFNQSYQPVCPRRGFR